MLTKGHTQSDDTDTLSIYVDRDTVPSSVLDFAFVWSPFFRSMGLNVLLFVCPCGLAELSKTDREPVYKCFWFSFIFHRNIAVSRDIRVTQNACLSLFEAGDRIHIDCLGSCLASLFEPTWCGSSTCRCHHSSVAWLRFGPLLLG